MTSEFRSFPYLSLCLLLRYFEWKASWYLRIHTSLEGWTAEDQLRCCNLQSCGALDAAPTKRGPLRTNG